MTAFINRFRDFYYDPCFLPRSRVRSALDVLPALLFAVRGR